MPELTLEEQYRQETGKEARALTTDGVHVVQIEVYRFDYVAWLEQKAIDVERRKE